MSISDFRRRRGLDQPALAHVELGVAQQVERAEHAVHRGPDLVAHRRQELRLRHVGGLGRFFRLQQRRVGEVGLQAVTDRADVVLLTSREARTIVRPNIAIKIASGHERTLSISRLAATTEPIERPTSQLNDLPTNDMKSAAVATEPIAMTTYVVARVPLSNG